MADQSDLSSRAILGMYYVRQNQDTGAGWIDKISNLFTSDQESETYKWMGMSPVYREWVAGRQAKAYLGQGLTLTNMHYEATIEFAKKDVRRDKTGQIRARMEEFSDRERAHWASLLSTLIVDGEADNAYDGKTFFATDHEEGDSTSQDNDIVVDISAMPADQAGSITAPGVGEMQWAIVKGITQIMGFKDDQGEPMNEGASGFLVLVPPSLYMPAVAAMSTLNNSGPQESVNPNMLRTTSVAVEMNTRLSAWTDQFVVFRTDSAIKPLIRQQEQPPELKAKAEGSEFEFDNDAWQFGVDTWRTVGYGFWQYSCLVDMD